MAFRPDIILLVLDTQRVDRLSCYGYPRETSPYLDALAQDATLFRHGISAAQWTIPSHTSMFTGLYPSEHATIQTASRIPKSLPTLAERLRASGYFTAAFCNNPLVGVVNNGLRRGFTSFLNYSGWMTSRPNEASAAGHMLDRYRQHFKHALVDAMTGLQDIFARSDTLLDFSFNPLMRPFWQTALSFKGNTGRSLRDANQLLTKRAGVERGQPIFCFINLMGTHMPYHPSPAMMKQFAPQLQYDATARKYLNRFNNDVFGWLAPLNTAMTAAEKTILDTAYNAEVAIQDKQVGAFLDQQRASGELDRSLLIVSADHGEHLGEKQLMGHSFSAYNELVHVPLIVRDPAGNFPRGSTRDYPVSTRRIFHTALTAAQATQEAEETELTLAADQSNDVEHEQVFAEAFPVKSVLTLMEKYRPQQAQQHLYNQLRRATWQGRYKLILTGDGQHEKRELYDIVADPEETVDLSLRLPEETKTLQRFFDAARVPATIKVRHSAANEQTNADSSDHDDDYDNYNDPEVQRRLRDLGYIG